VVISVPLVASARFSGASLLLLESTQVSPAGRPADVQLNVTLVLIMVVVGFALSVIAPQLSTDPLLVTLPLMAVIVELPGVKQVASPEEVTDATAVLVDA
jgi:hypothetical protein